MVKWLSWYLNSQTLSTQILGVADGCSKVIIIWYHTSKKHLVKDTCNVFSILKEVFVTVLTLFANILSWHFDKVNG